MAKRRGIKEWEPGFDPKKRGVEAHEMGQCLIVSAPVWFARDDFQEWARTSGVARWSSMSEWQDVFLVYADGDLDWTAKDLPKDIDRTLVRLAETGGMEYGVIWIKPV